MPRLPKVITTSVVRSSRQGESHGGVYLIDLESGDVEQMIDWNDPAINWEGRGGDRGLRGIAFYSGRTYIAASDEIFAYSREFKLLESYRNQYLKHCHEIHIVGDTLYLASTGLNSILLFDLVGKRFRTGYVIAVDRGLLGKIARAVSAPPRLRAIEFDPMDKDWASAGFNSSDLHINNVTRHGDAIMIAGTKIETLLALQGGKLRRYAPLPIGTHNAAVYKDGIIYNDTRSDRIVIANKRNQPKQTFAVPKYDDLPDGNLPNDHARQGFARGLCAFGDDLIIAGSSPSTVSVYEISSGKRICSVNVSKDIRNCIHGLELWRYQ